MTNFIAPPLSLGLRLGGRNKVAGRRPNYPWTTDRQRLDRYMYIQLAGWLTCSIEPCRDGYKLDYLWTFRPATQRGHLLYNTTRRLWYTAAEGLFRSSCHFPILALSTKFTFSPCVVLVVAFCYLGHPKNWLIDWLIDWPYICFLLLCFIGNVSGKEIIILIEVVNVIFGTDGQLVAPLAIFRRWVIRYTCIKHHVLITNEDHLTI